MAKRDAIFPAGRDELYTKHRYSAAIRSGDLLFVSGQVGSRDDGSPEPDFAKQVQLAFDRLNAVLAAAGASFDDVVDVTTFHTDPEKQFETVMTVRDRAIGTALSQLDRGGRDLVGRVRFRDQGHRPYSRTWRGRTGACLA